MHFVHRRVLALRNFLLLVLPAKSGCGPVQKSCPQATLLKLIVISVILIGVLFAIPLTQAQETPTESQSARTRAACYDQLQLFIISLLSRDNAKEYWKDLLERNRCQQSDIFPLDDQIEALMKRLREEYYEHCSSEKITTYTREIQEKKMEIHFIRNIVALNESTATQQDIDAFLSTFEAHKESLKKKMIKRYVTEKKWLTESAFNALFEEWLTRYEDRFEEYLSCPSSAWAEVADEWQEFTDELQEVITFFKGLNDKTDEEEEQNAKEQAEKDAESQTGPGGEKKSPLSAIKDYLNKHIDMKINGLEPEKGLEEIIQEAKKNGQMLSTDEAFEILNLEKESYASALTGAEMMGRYALLYREGSAAISTELTQKIERLSDVVKTSTTSADYLSGLQKSAKAIHKKQGKGTP